MYAGGLRTLFLFITGHWEVGGGKIFAPVAEADAKGGERLLSTILLVPER